MDRPDVAFAFFGLAREKSKLTWSCVCFMVIWHGLQPSDGGDVERKAVRETLKKTLILGRRDPLSVAAERRHERLPPRRERQHNFSIAGKADCFTLDKHSEACCALWLLSSATITPSRPNGKFAR